MEEINISQEASLPALKDPSTADSQLQRLDRRVENERKNKLKKRKQEEGIDVKIPIDLLRRLGPLFTKWNIPHEAAVEIVAATYEECNYDQPLGCSPKRPY